MKTIAQELGVTDFPFDIKDERGNLIYLEFENKYWAKYKYDSKNREVYYQRSDNYWVKREYDSKGREIYYETSNGLIKDNRPKPQAEPMTIEIDGKKYKLIEL
jgi:hypothetical protein